MGSQYIGELEQMVLLSILNLGDEAYPYRSTTVRVLRRYGRSQLRLIGVEGSGKSCLKGIMSRINRLTLSDTVLHF